MKKLLLAFFLVSPLYAGNVPDRVTSGPMGLLKPSTTTPDSTRTAGDKLNSNFDIIAATVAKALTQTSAIATDTTTIANRAAMISIYNAAGTFVGNATTIKINNNLTVSFTGSSATVDGTAASGLFNSTKTLDITLAGQMFLSTQTIFGFPGTTRSPGKSTWTITDLWADCAKGSTVGVAGFDLVYSSWGGPGPGGAYSKLFDRMDVSTISFSATGGVQAASIFRSSISFIGAHTYLGVLVSTLPASGDLPCDCHVHCYYWEANKYSP